MLLIDACGIVFVDKNSVTLRSHSPWQLSGALEDHIHSPCILCLPELFSSDTSNQEIEYFFQEREGSFGLVMRWELCDEASLRGVQRT